jgi:hypothetical protein
MMLVMVECIEYVLQLEIGIEKILIIITGNNGGILLLLELEKQFNEEKFMARTAKPRPGERPVPRPYSPTATATPDGTRPTPPPPPGYRRRRRRTPTQSGGGCSRCGKK